jgi:formate hydrogenlyase subunit 4
MHSDRFIMVGNMADLTRHFDFAEWGIAFFQTCLVVMFAPLFVGWIKKVKARLQGRQGAPISQPYRNLRKLLTKEALVSTHTSFIFLMAPYAVFVSSLLIMSTIPVFSMALPNSFIADAIAMIGLLAVGRVFLTLAGLDTGTAFGGMGASREMMVSAGAEPALLMSILTLAMVAHSTNLSTIIDHQVNHTFVLRPSFLFIFFAILMVAIAETGRIPVDNPATHLELTMIHEAMILEYSGHHLALMEWASQLKITFYALFLINIFFPWGIATQISLQGLSLGLLLILLKLMLLGSALALFETVLAKMRVFRVPQFLNLAFLLSTLGLFSFIMLESGA